MEQKKGSEKNTLIDDATDYNVTLHCPNCKIIISELDETCPHCKYDVKKHVQEKMNKALEECKRGEGISLEEFKRELQNNYPSFCAKED